MFQQKEEETSRSGHQSHQQCDRRGCHSSPDIGFSHESRATESGDSGRGKLKIIKLILFGLLNLPKQFAGNPIQKNASQNLDRSDEPGNADSRSEFKNPLSNTSILNLGPRLLQFRTPNPNISAQSAPTTEVPRSAVTNLLATNSPAATPPGPPVEFTLFGDLTGEIREMVWRRTFPNNRVIEVRRRRQLHVQSFTLVNRLELRASAPVEALSANQESRFYALQEYPQAFGMNLASYLGEIAAQTADSAFAAHTRYSATRDIVYIDDQANVGLGNLAHLFNHQDRIAIQRLAAPINTSQNADIVGEFISQLPLFSGLRELILIVNNDVPAPRRHSRRGFSSITAAWDAALTNHYDSVQAQSPQASRPVWNFQIPGWESYYEGRNRVELGVVGVSRRASADGRNGMDARPAVRGRHQSL